MEPKLKAEELYNKMKLTMPHHSVTNASVYLMAQQCALIAVDEMNENGFLKPNSVGFILNDVKNEIEKL